MAFTFFFRDNTVLELIAKHVVPNLVGYSRIRIWDGGCAMGPEPYSLAITIAESMGPFAFRNIHIDATDIDEQENFGKTIEMGVYPSDQVQRIPQEILAKYFVPAEEQGYYRIIDTVRQSIHFRKHDLLSLKPIAEGFHLIMCKNVLLHFQPKERSQVIKMFHSALATGGYFATEKTQEMPEELKHLFELISPEVHLYKKVEAAV